MLDIIWCLMMELPYSNKFSRAKIFVDRPRVNFSRNNFRGSWTRCLFYLATPQLRKLLSVVSDGCNHSVLCCTLSYLRLKFGRNLCVGASFFVVRSSISSTSLTSAFANAMEDDGTAVDREPRGSGSLAGLSTLRKEP